MIGYAVVCSPFAELKKHNAICWVSFSKHIEKSEIDLLDLSSSIRDIELALNDMRRFVIILQLESIILAMDDNLTTGVDMHLDKCVLYSGDWPYPDIWTYMVLDGILNFVK